VSNRPNPIRRASVEDAGEIARLLHDFNTEFSAPTPGVAALAENARRLLTKQEMAVLLGGAEPDGIALIRFRLSVWTAVPEAHLQELYVAPARRGEGLGRTLLEAAIELAREQGATTIDLGTSVTDTAARALYESAGFTNREWEPDGPSMLFYEREI
jgi:ribosomal protein S18 acetylase RimI-like enzyme